MANNPLSRYFHSRFIQPAVEKAVAATLPVAYGTSMVRETSLVKAIGQPHQVDPVLLYSLYKFNADISGSVHKWASKSTNGGSRLSLVDPHQEMTPELQARSVDIDRWISNPNPQDTMASILYWTAMQLPIIGRAFWYVSRDKKGVPLEIWPMHPAITRIVATGHGEILGYVMRTPGSEPVVFTPEEVIYFKLPNPTNSVSGEGRVELLIEEAGIDLLALRSNKSIFQNGQSYSAVIMLDESATPAQAEAITESIKQAHTGAENQHKLVAVSKARDFKPMTMTMRDMEFVGMRHLSTEKVTTAMGVPEFLLGNHNTGDYQSGKFLVREFHADIVQMVQGLLGSAVTERLIHSIDDRFRWSLIPPDSSDPDDLRNDLMEANRQGVLTKDEVRQDAFGKDPLPTSIKEDEPTDEQPDTEAADTHDADEADEAPTAKALKTVAKAISPDDYVTDVEWLAALAAERDSLFDELSGAIVPTVAAFFSTYEQQFMAGFDQGLADMGVDAYVDQQTDALDTMLTAVLVAAMLPSLNAGMNAASANLGFTLSNEARQRIIDTYGTTVLPQHAAGINSTTRAKLKATLTEGITANEDTARLRERAAQIFREGQEYRAALIAEAESVQAFDHANYESVRSGEQTLDEIEQVWLTERDTRVCQLCLPMDGQAVPVDAPFIFPGTDIELEPGSAHVRCRCSRYFRRISS